MNTQIKTVFLLIVSILIYNTFSTFSQNASDSLVVKNIKEITESIEKGISNGQAGKNVLLILGNDCFTYDEFKASKNDIKALRSGKIRRIDIVNSEAANRIPICPNKEKKDGICFVIFCTEKTRECLSETEMQKIEFENKRNRIIINDSANYPVVTLTEKYNVMRPDVDHSALNISLKPSSGLIIDVSQIDMITKVYKKMSVYKLLVRVDRYEADVLVNNDNKIVVHAWQLIDKNTGKEFHGFTDRSQPVFLDIQNTEKRSTQGMYMFLFDLKE